MLKEERHQHILDVLYASGKVNVEELAYDFRLSKDTIRRDLNELEGQGILKRVYGGAIPQKRQPLALDARKNLEKNEKYMVAKRATGLVRPHSLIAVDGGTTNTLFASLMPVSITLRVVTNSFPVAEELRKRPNIDVIFLGGRYNKESQTTVGETVYQQLKEFYFDQCFLGAFAVDAQNGISVPYPYEDESSIKRLLVENSSEVNVMCSCSKLNKISNYVICSIDAVDRIICEHPVTKQLQAKYKNKICW
ncbi:MAG: DeoR/GlpR transcriptional regulator [Clostridiales bacterium]|nr:DeoR/GlpR transcriptional regulator [Clostridiales bacterium]